MVQRLFDTIVKYFIHVYKFIYMFFIIISENEERVINALEDGNVTILCNNNDDLMTKNSEVINEIDESKYVELKLI